jgi:polyhydroxybutyrate depolymerase
MTALGQCRLVISYHGFGGNGPAEEAYDHVGSIADTENYLVAYPTAYRHVWNAGADYYGRWTTEDEVTFTSDLIDIIAHNFNMDLARVYVCGISNGRDMVYRLACEPSNRIAAVASVAGSMITDIYSSCNPAYQMPIVHFHGTADRYTPTEGGPGFLSLYDTIALWYQINSCVKSTSTLLPDLDPKDRTRVTLYESTSDKNAPYFLYLVNHGGHNWPGTPYNKYTVHAFGYTCDDIDASVEMWKFFREFTREEAAAFKHEPVALFVNAPGY